MVVVERDITEVGRVQYQGWFQILRSLHQPLRFREGNENRERFSSVAWLLLNEMSDKAPMEYCCLPLSHFQVRTRRDCFVQY